MLFMLPYYAQCFSSSLFLVASISTHCSLSRDRYLIAVCMQTHPDVAGTKRTPDDSVERFKRVSAAYSVLGNQRERRRYDFEISETGIRDLRDRRRAAASAAAGRGGGAGMGSGSFAATLPRNLLIGGTLGFVGVMALRTMWPTKEDGDGTWTSRTGQRRLVEAWKDPDTGRWETPRPWDPMYQKLNPPLQLVPRDQVDGSKRTR